MFLSPFCELLHMIFILKMILEQKDRREEETRPKIAIMSILEGHAVAWKIMPQHADHHSNSKEEHALAWLNHALLQESYDVLHS